MIVQTNEEGRIVLTMEEEIDGVDVPNKFNFDFPVDFDFSQQYEYKIINGELLYCKSDDKILEEQKNMGTEHINSFVNTGGERVGSLEETQDTLLLAMAEIIGA